MNLAPQSLPQVLILLADPILEGPYRQLLKSPSYCTVWCEQGDRWKESLLSFSYHVIVVDFSLFPETPMESLLAIKKLSPESEIIVLSHSDDVRIAISAFQNGVSDYFLKPTSPETLAWSIEKIIRKRALLPADESLNADLMVFEAAHHIGIAESDNKMRELALKHISSVLHASHAEWRWPEEGTKSLTSFESGLTSHPEKWVSNDTAWIPLKSPWMGGIALAGITSAADASDLARAEFLVRNIEISLENYQRYSHLKELSYVDDLTGLYNSRYLTIALDAAFSHHAKSHQSFSLLFIDIDHFKNVNDGNGHLVGSQILVELGHLLKRTIRKPDLLFRYGGDEFIAILYHANSSQGLEVAERLRSETQDQRFFIHQKEMKITLSIGVATFPEHGSDKKTILQMADNAMYSGKKQGRNSVFIAEPMTPKKSAA